MSGVVIDAKAAGVKADGSTDDVPALQRIFDSLPPAGGHVLLPMGVLRIDTAIVRPPVSCVWVKGYGIGLTTLDASRSKNGAFLYAGGKRISYCYFQDFTVHGTTQGGSGIGFDITDADRCSFFRLRVQAFQAAMRLTSTPYPGGALLTVIEDCVCTNCDVGIELCGVQGAHETSIQRGELSICKTGLLIHAPTEGVRVFGTKFESDELAIDCDGRKNYFNCRFDSNKQDVQYGEHAYDNVLETSHYDAKKYKDGGVKGRNHVREWGLSG